MKKMVLIGVSSGIAAFKVLELITELKREGINVFVIMTENASKMVLPLDFEKASGNKVYTTLFEKGFDYKNILISRTVDHIVLADKADLMVIVPATANTIGKIAHGIADDFLTTTALAVTAPIVVCPSMNVNMWNNPIVQSNISQLISFGYHIIPPTEGMLACGYEGKGRLEDVGAIKDEIIRYLNQKQSLKGKKIIVTTGGTIEKIDDIRYIANRSSGKMGVAIAEECYLRGADVLLLQANSSVKSRYNILEETFDTADELFNLVKTNISDCDIFFHVAAVSDFEIENKIKGKISSKKNITLRLRPRKKIIDQIKKLNPKTYLIAFKAEYGLSQDALINASRKKLEESMADVVVGNDVSRRDAGFQSDSNEVFVVSKDKTALKVPLSSKREIAFKIVEFVNSQFTPI